MQIISEYIKMIKLLMLVFLCESISILLPQFTQYCFSIDGKPSHKLWGAYVISGEGDKNILVRLLDQRQQIKYINPKDTREGKFEMNLFNSETLDLCFKSTDSYEKTVSFEFSYDIDDFEEIIDSDKGFSSLVEDAEKSSKLMDTVYRNLHFYERRESVHRDLTEKTCDRIFWGVLLKIVILSAISLTQIWVLKGFFDLEKSRV